MIISQMIIKLMKKKTVFLKCEYINYLSIPARKDRVRNGSQLAIIAIHFFTISDRV
jgi:hypothetical protein